MIGSLLTLLPVDALSYPTEIGVRGSRRWIRFKRLRASEGKGVVNAEDFNWRPEMLRQLVFSGTYPPITPPCRPVTGFQANQLYTAGDLAAD